MVTPRIRTEVWFSVRFPLLLALSFGAVSVGFADRVITVPMGRKIPYQNFKVDSFFELSRTRSLDRWLGVGISPEFELAYHGERINGGPLRDTLDFSWNYVTPLMNQAPGISVGVQDALNRTRDGRRFYLAVTWRNAVDNIGMGNIPLEVTIGVFQGKRTLPMVGVSIPFSEGLRLLAEDNGYRIASGLEYRALNNAFGARLVIRDQDVMVGANLTLRF